MARWRRVETPRSFFETTIVVSVVMAVLTVVLFVGYPWHPTVGLAVAFLLLLTVIAVRANRMGVYHSELGVRSRSLLRTWTVPWEAVAKFEDRPAVSNPWTLGGGLPARAIWIVLDGDAIQTPLVYEPVPFTGDPSRNRWKWSKEECRVAFEQLNRALAAARREPV